MRGYRAEGAHRILAVLALATVLFLFASPAVAATSGRPRQQTPADYACAVGGCTYVTEEGSTAVGVISKANKLIKTISTDEGGCPFGATFDPATGLIFVTDNCLGDVYKINPATNTIFYTLTGFQGAGFIVCDDSIPACFVTQIGSGTVTSFNPFTLVVSKTVKQCGTDPWYIAFDSNNGQLYVGDYSSNCVTVENPVTGGTNTITLGKDSQVTGITVAKNGLVYVDESYPTSPNVYVIRGETVVKSLTVSSYGASGNTYSPEGNLVWVLSDSKSGYVAVPVKGFTVGKAVATGADPLAACRNPGNREVYIPDYGASPGEVTVISGATVFKTVSLGHSAAEPLDCASN